MFASWKQPDDPETGRPDAFAIALFFVIACGWSWAAGRWGGVRLPGGPQAPVIDGAILVGFGPVMGALVADLVRPMRRAGRIGFLGLSHFWGITALLAPAICLAAAGLRLYRFEPHVDGLTMGLSLSIYCIGEELGWREWLHNALGGIAPWRGAMLTWVLWFAWHWTFLWPTLSVPIVGAVFALILLAASFGLSAVVRRTKSSAIAAGWHAAAKAIGTPAQFPMLILLGLATWLATRRSSRSSAGPREPRLPEAENRQKIF